MTEEEAAQCELAMRQAIATYERMMPARLSEVGAATGMLGALIGALVVQRGSEQTLEILTSIIDMLELAVEMRTRGQFVVDVPEGRA